MLLLVQEVSKLKKQAFTLRLVYREKRGAMHARSERPQQRLTDRLDRDRIVIRLRLYPIFLVHLGPPAVITADSHLLMV
jgi:hypothetical protein